MDEVAQLTKVLRLQKFQYVDSAGVNLQGICLTEGDLGIDQFSMSQEVSRGHSNCANELVLNTRGLSKQ